MKLEEKHKQFTVKLFAKMMTRAEVVEAFMQEFEEELPKPPIQEPEYPSNVDQENNDETDINRIIDRDQHYNDCLLRYDRTYRRLYGNDAKTRLEQDLPKLREQIEKDYQEQQKMHLDKIHNENLAEYKQQLQLHRKKLRSSISTQLRRYNISHNQFPLKYRELFYQTHKEYLAKLLTDSNTNTDDITIELKTLYGYIKKRLLQGEHPKETNTTIRLAHTLLKTIASNKL